MNRSFKLFRLQRVDSQLDRANSRLAEIALILGNDEVLLASRSQLEDALQAVKDAQKELSRAEADVKTQQIKIDQNQATLYSGSVTNPKELQDLQAESAALSRHHSKLEDIQLEKMLVLENKQDSEHSAQKTLHEIEFDREKEHGDLLKEQKTLQEELIRLQAEHSAAAQGINEVDTKNYLKLRESKKGLAVAKVKENACSACGTQLSHSLAQAARSTSDISFCSTCKRILYTG